MYLPNLTEVLPHSATPDQWWWKVSYPDGVSIDGYTTSDGRARDLMMHTRYATVTVDPFYVRIKSTYYLV